MIYKSDPCNHKKIQKLAHVTLRKKLIPILKMFQNERTIGSSYFKILKELAISMKEPTQKKKKKTPMFFDFFIYF
jgi:hypothetical protein